MYIQTETTPNPEALKFLPGFEISREPIFFDNKEHAFKESNLALKLLSIDGVCAVFFGSDFITITKSEALNWDLVKTEVLMTIQDHFMSGLTSMNTQTGDTVPNKVDLSNFSEIEKQIYELIETRVRPSVAMDGGDITYLRFEDNIVYLRLKGSCSGCPSSEVTLKKGILSTLQYYVPEVEDVVAEN